MEASAGLDQRSRIALESMSGSCWATSSDFFQSLARAVLSLWAVANLFSAVAPLQYALDFHLERHNLLAANIANVDTPRYKPTDLARISEGGEGSFESAMQLAMARTNEAHLSTGADEPLVGRTFQDLSAGGGADGNFVSLDRESGKLASNRLRYDIVSVLVKSQLDALMSAASDGKG
jgi:flagellar basal-body rod protein FlgB